MKAAKSIFWTLLFWVTVSAVNAAEQLKPFTLAYTSKGDIKTVVDEVTGKLSAAGFQVVGRYSPFADATVVVITTDELKQIASKSEFGGYGAVQRVSVTKVKDELQVAYTNPPYWANAFRMADDLKGVHAALQKALGRTEDFGAKGLTPAKLRKYHYLFGMEYFDEPSILSEHKSYEEAVKSVEQNLAKNTAGVSKVYRVDVPGKKETVFGVGMKRPPKGDKYMDDEFIMSVIDFKDLRSTAHLPYEILVSGNKVYSLYARFRIAVSFPDLPMMGDGSFMNIMETPEAVRRALTMASGGKVNDNYWE